MACFCDRVRAVSLVLLFCALAFGCWSRPLGVAEPPESLTSFQAAATPVAIPKVDLVFAIDDSASMADKHALLAPQISAMVSRLLSPRCFATDIYDCSSSTDCSALGANAACDVEGIVNRCVVPGNLGACPAGTRAEFPAIHDLHVGVVRSDGRLFGGTLERAQPINGAGGGFLAWLPRSRPENRIKPAPNVQAYGDGEDAQFIADLAALVDQVGTNGPGIESQLESWYRFLIEPKPYASIEMGYGTATLVGVDSTVLAMRHDFLRPDSFVVIVQITDEDDASLDPLDPSTPFMQHVALAPRGTSACDVDPASAACSSCAFPENASEPNCQKGWYTPGEDSLDVRFTDDMKRRYGLDPHWKVQRYIDGLRLAKIGDCSNPLFAGSLPDGTDTSPAALCNLPAGYRTPDLVSYALVGGVAPSRLVDAKGNFKLDLYPDDWDKLTGSPRDPHMVESIAPRALLPVPSATYALGTDPDLGREWNTTNAAGVGDLATSVDLQFACTFDLPAPRDCTIESPCDCAPGSAGATAPDGPPLCDPNARTTQVRGKAYPSTRELRVAQGLGMQAVVRSICTPWMPALLPLFQRLGEQPDGQCFPETLQPRADCSFNCQMLVVYYTQTDQAAGCTDPGTSQPDPATLDYFRRQYLESLGDASGYPIPVACTYRQFVGPSGAGCFNPSPDYSGGSCVESPSAGWCYVVGAANTGGCPQTIAFGGGGPPPGTAVDLVCLQ